MDFDSKASYDKKVSDVTTAGANRVSLLNEVVFTPSHHVIFKPTKNRQYKDLSVKNEAEKAVMFKMKSTRPGSYKMRPVYFVLQPRERKQIKLTYKGQEKGTTPHLTDRFSIVMAYAPASSQNAQKMFKDQKYLQKIVKDGPARKHIQIRFEGYETEEPKKKKKAKAVFVAAPQPTAAPPPAPAEIPQQDLVYVIYTDPNAPPDPNQQAASQQMQQQQQVLMQQQMLQAQQQKQDSDEESSKSGDDDDDDNSVGKDKKK